MKRNLSLLGLAAVLTAPVCAADNYTIDSKHAFPVFEVNHLGFTTQRGRFDKTSGKITLDLAARKGSVELTIDTTSLDMGFEEWNRHVTDEKFFNVSKYPTMTYRSQNLIFDGDKVVAADGELTLLGVTRPLRVTVSGFKCATHPMLHKPLCAGDVSAHIKRSDFGMSQYVPAVGDDVKIDVPIEAYQDTPTLPGDSR